MPFTISFLGKAGAGKGTQAHLLEQKFDAHIIGAGDMFRAFAKKRTPAARRVQRDVLDAGQLAPSWLVSYLWTHALMQLHPERHVILDGCPRMLPEAKQLDETLDWLGRGSLTVFWLDITDEEATRRLLSRRMCQHCHKIYQGDSAEVKAGVCPCGGTLAKRHDDTPETITNRLAYFPREVMPVVEHYKTKGGLVRIDGAQSAEKVHQDILSKLQPK